MAASARVGGTGVFGGTMPREWRARACHAPAPSLYRRGLQDFANDLPSPHRADFTSLAHPRVSGYPARILASNKRQLWHHTPSAKTNIVRASPSYLRQSVNPMPSTVIRHASLYDGSARALYGQSAGGRRRHRGDRNRVGEYRSAAPADSTESRRVLRKFNAIHDPRRDDGLRCGLIGIPQGARNEPKWFGADEPIESTSHHSSLDTR